jgi:hypothetical protein
MTLGAITATLIHPSLILVLIYLPIRYFKPDVTTLFGYLAVALIIGYFDLVFDLIRYASENISYFSSYTKKVINYRDLWPQSGSSFSLYTMLFTFSIFYIYRELIISDKLARNLFYISFVGAIIVMLIINDAHLYGRVIKIFRVFDIALLCRLQLIFHGGYSSIYLYISLLFLSIMFFFKDILRVDFI